VRHFGAAARIEVEPHAFALVREQRKAILAYLNTLGFLEVMLNLDGYRMGSLNANPSPRLELL